MIVTIKFVRFTAVLSGIAAALCTRAGLAQSNPAGRATVPPATAAPTPTPLDVSKLPRLRLIEDLRLDGAKEDFSVIGRVAVNRNGGVAVPMMQDLQIRVYDANGKLLATVGRKGAGPGEFGYVGSVYWLGDSLFVSDGVYSRMTYFGPDLKLLRTQTTAAPRRTATGNAAASDTVFARFAPALATNSGQLFGSARLIVGGNSALAPSVFVMRNLSGDYRVIAAAPSYEDQRWQLVLGGLGNPIPFAFQPVVHTASDASRFVTMTADQRTRNPRIDIAAHELTGRKLYAVAFTVPGTPISSAVADSGIKADFPDLNAAQSEGPPRMQWRALAKKNIPATFSPVERIAIGHDSRAWVTMRATASGQDVLVLDERGAPSALAALPARSRVEQATSTHVWITQRDNDGLPSVVRYRITR